MESSHPGVSGIGVCFLGVIPGFLAAWHPRAIYAVSLQALICVFPPIEGKVTKFLSREM